MRNSQTHRGGVTTPRVSRTTAPNELPLCIVGREHVLTKAVVLQLAREVRNYVYVDKELSAKPATIRAITSTARSTLVHELGCPAVPLHDFVGVGVAMEIAIVHRADIEFGRPSSC